MQSNQNISPRRLQKYTRGASQSPDQPISVSSVAHELAKKELSPRRLQKYLSKTLPPKDLSIKLCDLEAIARLGDLQLGEFVAYLLQESRSSLGSRTQSMIQDSLQSFHEGHRRALAATLFSGKNQKSLKISLKLL